MGEVTRQIAKGHPNFFQNPPLRYLVISLGTGTQKQQPRYDAEMAAKWGVFGWLVNNGSAPLVEVFTQASSDLVSFHSNVVFEALNSIDNYHRIQVFQTHYLSQTCINMLLIWTYYNRHLMGRIVQLRNST